MSGDYSHPDGGRIYREDDPAHHFAVLARILGEQARQYIDHYERRMAGRDYLSQHGTWQSCPDRIARSMAHTIAALDKAYIAVVSARRSVRGLVRAPQSVGCTHSRQFDITQLGRPFAQTLCGDCGAEWATRR